MKIKYELSFGINTMCKKMLFHRNRRDFIHFVLLSPKCKTTSFVFLKKQFSQHLNGIIYSFALELVFVSNIIILISVKKELYKSKHFMDLGLISQIAWKY